MMYLPLEIPNAKVLVAVKTYPNPSLKYDELICNAGFLEEANGFAYIPYDSAHSRMISSMENIIGFKSI